MSNKTTTIRSAMTIIAAAFILTACGGADTADTADTTAPVINETSISAAPAFLNRSCDGQDSPHLFCPNVNGG